MLIIAWIFVAWSFTGKLSSEKIASLVEREQDSAVSSAETIGASVGRMLAHMRSIPKVLAKDPEIQQILGRMGPDIAPSVLPRLEFKEKLARNPALERLNKRLDASIADLDIDQILVMNAAGDCVASAGFFGDGSPNGVNYTDREYFQTARRKGAARQFAIGRTSNTPGIYYSAAVVDNNRFLGIVVVKIETTRLGKVIDSPNAFIADEFGVIIVAGDESYYMKTMPGARVGELPDTTRERRYKRKEFTALELRDSNEGGLRLVRLEGRKNPLLMVSSETQSDLLSVWYFSEIRDLERIRLDSNSRFLLLCLAGGSVVLSVYAGIAYLRRNAAHQAEVAGINAELVKLNDELKIQARFDALTGCANRRYFMEELSVEIKRAKRFERHCCLAMFDIDHFKKVNDCYGHANGDEMLKHFSQTVKSCLRETDFFGRIGGEEFALLMPQTPIVGGFQLVERIREIVEKSTIAVAGVASGCTVSIGIAEWRRDQESGETFLARADSALYKAKRLGRNRVCSAQGAMPGDCRLSLESACHARSSLPA